MLKRYIELYEKGNKKMRGEYMTMLENEFNIPMLNDEKYNNENKEVIELYKRFAEWDLE